MRSPFLPVTPACSRATWLLRAILAGAAAVATLVSGALARPTEVATVYSKTFNGYKRERLPDNSLKPENYSFAEGGYWSGSFVNHSIDDLSFLKIAHTIAGPLRSQKFLASPNAKSTDLIIFVYWGTTMGADTGDYSNSLGTVRSAIDWFNSAGGSGGATANALPPMAGMAGTAGAVAESMRSEMEGAMLQLQTENEQRDMNNYRNARILGYSEALNNAMEIPWMSTSQDVVQEVEMNRYFVVLRAFDFQQLWKHKKWKLLWETTYSIGEHRNRFDDQLENMTVTAAPFFGQNRGLARELIPEGHVHVGTPEEVPQQKR